MENVTSPDEKLAEFISFCIEIFKMSRNVQGAEVAELFEATGLLDFLFENYDMLHTLGKSQLLLEMERFLNNHAQK